MKIGIVGSREYENKLKIKEFIYQLKEKFGEELVIVRLGSFPDDINFNNNLWKFLQK